MSKHIDFFRKNTPLREFGIFFLVLAAFSIVTAAWFHIYIGHLSTMLIGPPEDNQQDFWNSWYAVIAADYRHFFQTSQIQFPEGTPLNFHSFAYPQVFVLVALSRVFGTDHATLLTIQNLTLLSSFPLTGLAGFYLSRHFTHKNWAALIGAYIIAFSPMHIAQSQHHIGVMHIEFIVFFVLFYLKSYQGRNAYWLLAAIGSYALSALFCWYYLIYCAYFIIFHSLYRHYRQGIPLHGWEIRIPLICLGGVSLILLPLLLPMLLQSGSPDTSLCGHGTFVADIVALFSFPQYHLFGDWFGQLYPKNTARATECVVYLGLINVAVLTWLTWSRWRCKDSIVDYVLWSGGVFLVLAAGETLHAFGHPLIVPMPGIVLSHIPLLSIARVPARLIVFVYIFMGIGVAHAFVLAQQTLRGRWGIYLLYGLAGLIVLDFCPSHLEMTDAVCPAWLSVIDQDKEKNFGILNLPHSYEGGDNAMLWATCHDRPIVHAEVSRFITPSLIDVLEMRDLEKQHEQLRKANVKYIILDKRVVWSNTAHFGKSNKFKTDVRWGGAFPWVRITKTPIRPPESAPMSAYMKNYSVIYSNDTVTLLRV